MDSKIWALLVAIAAELDSSIAASLDPDGEGCEDPDFAREQKGRLLGIVKRHEAFVTYKRANALIAQYRETLAGLSRSETEARATLDALAESVDAKSAVCAIPIGMTIQFREARDNLAGILDNKNVIAARLYVLHEVVNGAPPPLSDGGCTFHNPYRPA